MTRTDEPSPAATTLSDAVKRAVDTDLGPRQDWAKWPGGWANEISTALIDAVFSARARYTTVHDRGILSLVKAWRTGSSSTDSISGLIAEIENYGAERWAEAFQNNQHAPGRKASAQGGPTKAAAVLEAARAFAAAGIDCSGDFLRDADLAFAALRRTPGVGDATTTYFGMLLGRPGVKPDRMIHRFLATATGTSMTNDEARRLVAAVAEERNVSPIELEHAMWAWQRNQEGR